MNLKRNHEGFSVVELFFIIVLILVIGSAGYYVYKHVEKNKSPISIIIQRPPTNIPNGLFTYVNESNGNSYSENSLLVTYYGKKVATLNLPTGDDSFYVVSNNNKEVLIAEGTGNMRLNNFSGHQLLTVDDSGNITNINSSVAAEIFNNLYGGNGTYTYYGILGENNDYLYVACDTTDCYLRDLKLTDVSYSNLYSLPFQQSSMEIPSIQIDSSSVSNDIVYLTDSNSSSSAQSQLVKFNIGTKNIVKTYNLPNDENEPALISPNNEYAAYDNPSNYQPVILNLNTGKSTTVNSSLANLIAWTPDSSKILISNSAGSAEQLNAYYTIGYINVDGYTEVDEIPYSYPGSAVAGYNYVIGWYSNDLMYYSDLFINYTGNKAGTIDGVATLNISDNTGSYTLPSGYIPTSGEVY